MTMLVSTTTGNEFCLVYVILQKKNVNQKFLQRIHLHFGIVKELSLTSIGKQIFAASQICNDKSIKICKS